MRKTIKNNIFKNNLWNSEEAISENMKKTPPNSKKIIIINALNFILVVQFTPVTDLDGSIFIVSNYECLHIKR